MNLSEYLNYDGGRDRQLLIDGALFSIQPMSEPHEFMVRCLLFALSASESPLVPFDQLVIQYWEVEVPVVDPKVDPVNRYPDLMLVRPEHLERDFSRRFVPIDSNAPLLVVDFIDGDKPACAATQFQYAKRGIKEYWLADSAAQTVTVLGLDGERYRVIGVFSQAEVIVTPLFPEGATVPAEIFEVG
jgi:Uma2 family endonuclease